MKKGFTLVELSIVLVIIGLLIGGVLAAQSMISAAKLTSTIRQFGQYDAAVYNFQAKYNSVPGDSHLTYAIAVCCGTEAVKDDLITDNDAINNTAHYNAAGSEEYMVFWLDLASLMGLKLPGCDNLLTRADIFAGGDGVRVSGDECNFPQLKYGSSNNVAVFAAAYDTGPEAINSSNSNGNAYYMFGDCATNNTAIGCSPPFTQAEAAAFDAKTDDGIPNSGNVEAISDTSILTVRRQASTIGNFPAKTFPLKYDPSSSAKLSLIRKFFN